MISYRSSPMERTRIGCITPCARMLAASSCSAPSSMRVRGWYLPACMESRRRTLGRPSLRTASVISELPPSRASSPRPRPFFFNVAFILLPRSAILTLCPLKRAYALDHFRTELDIRLRATRCPVKHNTRQAVAGRFRQTDVAGNDDVEELVAEMLFQLIRYLLLQRNARIEHDAQ